MLQNQMSANHRKIKIYLYLQKYQFQVPKISILGPELFTPIFEAVKLLQSLNCSYE
jgi:hypothetical protein